MFYNIFERLCNEKGIKPGRAADEIGISRATVTNWKKNGYSPRKNVLEKIAEYFKVSADYLLSESEQKKIPADMDSEEIDIAIELEEMMQKLESDGSLMFDGNPASPEAIRSIKTALEMGLRYARDVEKGKSK